jgi:hypothetical protein
MVLGTVAVMSTWAACSSSTGPSSTGIGNWHFTVGRLVFRDAGSGITDTIDVRPAPFSIVVRDTGAASSGTFENVYGLDAEGDTVIRWGLGSATALVVSGDSIRVVLDNGTETCLLGIKGTIRGTTASGSDGVSCADSTISGGSWSATRS